MPHQQKSFPRKLFPRKKTLMVVSHTLCNALCIALCIALWSTLILSVTGVAQTTPFLSANENSLKQTAETQVIPAQILPLQCSQLLNHSTAELGIHPLGTSRNTVVPANYQPGVDVYGNPVAPADLEAPTITVPLDQMMRFDIVIDPLDATPLKQRFGDMGITARAVGSQGEPQGQGRANELRIKALTQRQEALQREHKKLKDKWTSLSIDPQEVNADIAKWQEERNIIRTQLNDYVEQADEKIAELIKETGGQNATSPQEKRRYHDQRLNIEQSIYFNNRYLDLSRREQGLNTLITNAREALESQKNQQSVNTEPFEKSQEARVLAQEAAAVEQALNQERAALKNLKANQDSAVFSSVTPFNQQQSNTVATVVYDSKRQLLRINGQPTDPAFARMVAQQCQQPLYQ